MRQHGHESTYCSCLVDEVRSEGATSVRLLASSTCVNRRSRLMACMQGSRVLWIVCWRRFSHDRGFSDCCFLMSAMALQHPTICFPGYVSAEARNSEIPGCFPACPREVVLPAKSNVRFKALVVFSPSTLYLLRTLASFHASDIARGMCCGVDRHQCCVAVLGLA